MMSEKAIQNSSQLWRVGKKQLQGEFYSVNQGTFHDSIYGFKTASLSSASVVSRMVATGPHRCIS